MPVTIKSVDRLMDRQHRRIGRDEGNIAAAAIGPPAAFVTRLWFVSLSLVARFSMRSEPAYARYRRCRLYLPAICLEGEVFVPEPRF
jgi:hypothetical protein